MNGLASTWLSIVLAAPPSPTPAADVPLPENLVVMTVRPGIELAATALLLQRVYVEVAEQVFFDGCDRTRGTDRMHRWCPTLSPDVVRDFKLHRLVVAAGFRFLPSTLRKRKRGAAP